MSVNKTSLSGLWSVGIYTYSVVLLTIGLGIGCRNSLPPTARFEIQPSDGRAPLQVTFSDRSTPGSSRIVAWKWDFGDQNTSSDPNPIYTYHKAGVYSVSLTVSSDAGEDSWTVADKIRVTAGAEESSHFAHPQASGHTISTEEPATGVPTSATRTFYVAADGNDGDDGSKDHPWMTLTHAAESVQAGDTVHVGQGTFSGDVDFTISGTAEAPIRIMGGSRDSTIVDGHVQLSQGVSHYEVASLTVQGFRIWGVTLLGDNHHVHLHDLNVIGGEAGFRFTDGNSGEAPAEGPVSDVVLENSEVEGPLGTAVDCTPGPCDRMVFRRLDVHDAGIKGEASFGADGIGLERGKDVLVEECNVHDNGGDGIDLNSRDFGGNVEGILVRRNRVVRNRLMGIKLWAGGRMENNVVWGQGLTPVVVGKYPGTYEVVNNSIAYNMYAGFSERDYALVAGYPNDDTGIPPQITLTMTNNIFAFNTGPRVGDGPTGIYFGAKVNLTESHNLYFSREDGEIQAEFVSRPEKVFSRGEIGEGTWAAASGQGEGDIVTNPSFMGAWPAVDLALNVDSPAADAGVQGGAPPSDIQGTPRPLGSAVSIGAYER